MAALARIVSSLCSCGRNTLFVQTSAAKSKQERLNLFRNHLCDEELPKEQGHCADTSGGGILSAPAYLKWDLQVQVCWIWVVVLAGEMTVVKTRFRLPLNSNPCIRVTNEAVSLDALRTMS